MDRSRKIRLVAAVAGLLIALAGPPLAEAEAPSPAERLAQESVLRLTELPGGYVLGEWFCGPPPEESEYEGIYEREEEIPPTPYERFVDTNEPTICFFPYERLYRPPGSPTGPPILRVFSMITPSAAAAEAGLGVGAELAANAFGLHSLYPIESQPVLGEASRLFRDNLLRHWRRDHLPGTIVLWRDGAILSGVLAGGATPAANDAAARQYAVVQQAIVEAPRPYEAAEAEDIPTFLDNPALGVPVYWLGRQFKVEGAPTSYFEAAYPRGYLPRVRGLRMAAGYNTALFLDSWTPSGWRKFTKTNVGRRQWTWHCTRSRTVKLAHGHAVIYASYRKGYETCPSFAPQHFIAHVYLPGAVVAIGQPLCRYCQGELGPEFASFSAMEAIVRGLRRWKPGDVATLALAGPAKPASRPAQIGMLMRLHELPPGYMLGDEGIGCERLDPEGTTPPLTYFLAEHLPKVCEVTYERLYPVSGQGADPPLVFGAVVDLRTAAVARQAEKMLPGLIERLTGGGKPTEGTTSVKLGSETRLFRGSALVAGHSRPASLLTWRQGGLIGVTMVGGEAVAPGDREATRMAQRQRAHMLRPSPYPASERDDLLVPLENPAVELPVYWLGRRFDPGGSADPLSLTSAYGPLAEGEAPPGARLELWYGQGALHLVTWTPESWAAYTAGKLGHELLAWHCTKTTGLGVPEGTATIYSGYDRNYGTCPSKPPTVFAAVVERGGVVLGMGLPACYSCLGGGPDRSELEAAVGALKLFPRP